MPGTKLRAILGQTRGGRLVFAISGAEGDPAPDPANPAPDPAPDPKPDPAPDPDPADLGAAGKKALDDERNARRDAEKRLNAALAENKKFKDAQLTETQRAAQDKVDAETRAAKAETALRTERVKNAAYVLASSAGARHPDDVWRLIDSDAVKFDDDGNPTNLKDLVERVKKDRPDYFKPGGGKGNGDGGVRGDAGTGPDMNSVVRRMAGRPA